MMLSRGVTYFGMATGLILLVYGVVFFVSPETGLALTYHQTDHLPLVMGGRYALFGALLIAALLYKDALVTMVLLIGFAWLAFVDTAIYWQSTPLPHAAIGLVCVAAALYFYSQRKADI